MSKFYLMVVLLLLSVNCALAGSNTYPKSVTIRQHQLLTIAYEEGAKIGYPETVQAQLWQETVAGSWHYSEYGIVGDDRYYSNHPNGSWEKGDKKPTGEKSYGVMQVKCSTAREVLKKYPELGSYEHDEQLITALLVDNRFNIRIGAHYFLMQLNEFENPRAWSKAVLSYNVGRGNFLKYGFKWDPNDYPNNVWSHIKNFIRPFNEKKITIK